MRAVLTRQSSCWGTFSSRWQARFSAATQSFQKHRGQPYVLFLGPHGALRHTADSHMPWVGTTKLPVCAHMLQLTSLWTQMTWKLTNQNSPFGKEGPPGTSISSSRSRGARQGTGEPSSRLPAKAFSPRHPHLMAQLNPNAGLLPPASEQPGCWYGSPRSISLTWAGRCPRPSVVGQTSLGTLSPRVTLSFLQLTHPTNSRYQDCEI